MPQVNAVPTLERLLKVTLMSRDAFARAARKVPSADLAEILVARALDLAHIADELRDRLAIADPAERSQTVERAQLFVVSVLEARRSYRLAMSDAMQRLMLGPRAPEPMGHREHGNGVRRPMRPRRTLPSGTRPRSMVTTTSFDRPPLHLMRREE